MAPHLKIIVERHADGYVAYPLGLERGVVIGQGDSYESALSDVRSALAFHAETFGPESLAANVDDGPVLEAFVAEVAVPVYTGDRHVQVSRRRACRPCVPCLGCVGI